MYVYICMQVDTYMLESTLTPYRTCTYLLYSTIGILWRAHTLTLREREREDAIAVSCNNQIQDAQ